MISLEALKHLANQCPSRDSVISGPSRLARSELCSRVEKIASRLLALGIREGDRIAVCLPNSDKSVCVLYAILLVDAVFIPIPYTDPELRRRYLLSDSDPKLIVAERVVDSGVPHLSFDDLLRGEQLHPIQWKRHDDNRDAYIIYTSGTTGRPKGVRIRRGALWNFVTETRNALELRETDVTLCAKPVHFDSAFTSVFGSLLSGACLVIDDLQTLLHPRVYIERVIACGVTHCSMAPSFLALLLRLNALEALQASPLRCISIGGEEASPKDIECVFDLLPRVSVINRYGPTEATIAVSSAKLHRGHLERGGPLPIGRPYSGVTFHLIGTDGKAVTTFGDVGELYIGGLQLMTGYWRDEDLTSACLRYDPVSGVIAYKTGDLVYRDRDEMFYFVERIDNVINRRGYRIALAEVLRTIAAIAGVVDVAGYIDRTEPKAPKIICFYVSAERLSKASIDDALSNALPRYMLPDFVIRLDRISRSSTGKVGVEALHEAFGRYCSGGG